MDPTVLQQISYGVYLIGSFGEGKLNGQTANALMQIAARPALVAVSINKKNLTHQLIASSQVFSASILSTQAPLKLIGLFGFKSGREVNKLEGVGYKIGKTGSPVFTDHALAYLEAKVIGRLDAGTHTIFTGEVVEAEKLSSGVPMTYAYYHEVKQGTSPETAPTFIRTEIQAKEPAMKKYICRVCGYIYDPEKGDPDSGVKPGTAFEALPENWVCPVCGAGKEAFNEVK